MKKCVALLALLFCNSPASQGTAYEQILSSSRTADRALVKTRSIKPGLGFAADYHYHLTFSGQRWYLSEVFYVDQDGQYESLSPAQSPLAAGPELLGTR